jgi:AraC-like DNA-binding protein
MIEFVYGGKNTLHKKGEFCKSATFPHYFFGYFLTPFCYLTENGLINGNAGDVLIIPPFTKVYHGPQKDMEEGFRNDWFYANGSEINALIQEFQLPLNKSFHISSPRLISECISAINNEIIRKRNGYKEKIDLIIKNMLIDLYREYVEIDSVELRIANAREFMQKNLEKNLTLKEIAEKSGYSVSRFSDLYQNQYGISPIADFLKMRLESAQSMLRYTTLSIEEISQKCGFGSIYHFSKSFKNATGYSPSAFRKL